MYLVNLMRWRNGNASVCKTDMRGFDSRPHLRLYKIKSPLSTGLCSPDPSFRPRVQTLGSDYGVVCFPVVHPVCNLKILFDAVCARFIRAKEFEKSVDALPALANFCQNDNLILCQKEGIDHRKA